MPAPISSLTSVLLTPSVLQILPPARSSVFVDYRAGLLHGEKNGSGCVQIEGVGPTLIFAFRCVFHPHGKLSQRDKVSRCRYEGRETLSKHRRCWRLGAADRRTCGSSLRTPVTTRLRQERRVRARQVCVCCWCETGRPASVGRTHGARRSLPCRGLPWQRQQRWRPTHMRRVFLERVWAITWRGRWPVCPSAGRPAQAPIPSAPGQVPCSTGGDRRAAAGPQAAQAPRPGCPIAQAGQGAGPAACGVQPPGRAPPAAQGRGKPEP